MSNKRSFQLSVFGAILFLIALISFAQSTSPVQAQTAGKTILDYSDELKLTGKQIKTIKAYLSDLEKKNRQLALKINSIDLELLILLERNGNMEQVINKLRKLFSIRAEIAIADIKTGRKIDNLLNQDQIKSWREIRLKEIQRIKKMD